MPKLPDELFRIQTTLQGTIEHVARVYVDGDGMFFVTLPADEPFHDFLYEFLAHRPAGLAWGDLKQAYKASCIRSNTLQGAKDLVAAALTAFHAVETARECMLVYRYSSGLAYWKNSDGTLTHNGGAEDADRAGHWAGRLAPERVRAGNDDEPTGLLLAAFAMNRCTHVRGALRKTEWEYWRAPTHSDVDIRAKLNALSPDECPKRPDGPDSPWTIIPYDEKAARFFYQTMLSLCRIDDQLRAFFGDRRKVAAAIESGKLPLRLT